MLLSPIIRFIIYNGQRLYIVYYIVHYTYNLTIKNILYAHLIQMVVEIIKYIFNLFEKIHTIIIYWLVKQYIVFTIEILMMKF